MTDGDFATGKPAKLAALGMVGLCVAFFLPLWPEEYEDFVVAPADLLMHGPGLREMVLVSPFLYAVGMLVLYVVRALARAGRFRRVLVHAACLLSFAFLMLGGLGVWGLTRGRVLGQGWEDLLALFLIAIWGASTLATFAVWAAAPEGSRMSACTALAGLCCLCFFGVLVGLTVTSGGRYGLWVSTGASALIFAGALWETLAAWRAPRLGAGTPAREGNP